MRRSTWVLYDLPMSRMTDEHRLAYRGEALEAGGWLGWLSIAGVAVALLTGRAGEQTAWVVALTALAAGGNVFFSFASRRVVSSDDRRQLLLDLWSGAVILFSGTLVIAGGAGSDLDLLFFLVMPFIASVQHGRRRAVWLATAVAAFVVASVVGTDPPPIAATMFRLVLLSASVVLALALSEAVAREAAGRSRAATRAELERALLAEAHHRVKNSLQNVADLLLLARPAGAEAEAFDSTAARIRSIAAVHRVLETAEGSDASADDVIHQIVAGIGDGIAVETERLRVSAAAAQQLGIVANELIANAQRHGRSPVVVRLTAGPPARLEVEDAGPGFEPDAAHLGLRLVRQVTEQGLEGTLSFSKLRPAGTRASVEFPATPTRGLA